MTPCGTFEDRLIDYADLSPIERTEVDNHVNGCAACRGYLALLRELDATLGAEVRGVHLDPQRVADVRKLTGGEPIARITRLPEWLDFVAASAVLAFAGGFAWQTGLFALLVSALRFSSASLAP